MKTRLLMATLALLLIITALTACVNIDEPSESNSSLPSLNASSDTPSSGEDSLPAETSESPATSEESAVTSADESSQEESSQPTSTVENPELPYQNISSLVAKDIKPDSLDEYFIDSMFIGDSIMVHFKNFTDARRSSNATYLGDAILFCASSYSAYHDINNIENGKYLPKYKGTQMKAADAVQKSGVTTVYLSVMALNELGQYSTSTCVQKAFDSKIKIMDEIRAKSPDVTFVILSNTYMIRAKNNYNNLNNLHISQLNNMMLDYCNENGIDFIDVSTILVKDGVLADEYCIDPDANGCHLTQNCYAMWTGILRNYAFAKQNGFYENPESMPMYQKN